MGCPRPGSCGQGWSRGDQTMKTILTRYVWCGSGQSKSIKDAAILAGFGCESHPGGIFEASSGHNRPPRWLPNFGHILCCVAWNAVLRAPFSGANPQPWVVCMTRNGPNGPQDWRFSPDAPFGPHFGLFLAWVLGGPCRVGGSVDDGKTSILLGCGSKAKRQIYQNKAMWWPPVGAL